jgi:RNA polymerase sigma-19 factor, ECF subfamily
MNWKSIIAKLRGKLEKKGQQEADADDLIQQAIENLIVYAEEGHEVLEPEAFLARVVDNLAINEYEKQKRLLLDPEAGSQEQSPSDPYREAEHESLVNKIQKLLDSAVGERARKLFFLHYFDGMTMREAAAQLSIDDRLAEKDVAKCREILSVNLRPLV